MENNEICNWRDRLEASGTRYEPTYVCMYQRARHTSHRQRLPIYTRSDSSPDYKFTPWYRWDLCSSELLCRVGWLTTFLESILASSSSVSNSRKIFYVLLTVHLGIILVNNQLDAQFSFMYVYFYSLHVSGSRVTIIRRINCISTTFGICHSL